MVLNKIILTIISLLLLNVNLIAQDKSDFDLLVKKAKFFELANKDSALYYHGKIAEQNVASNKSNETKQKLNSLSYLYNDNFINNKRKLAAGYLVKAMELAKELNDTNEIVKFLNKSGELNRAIKNYPQGKSDIKKSILLCEAARIKDKGLYEAHQVVAAIYIDEWKELDSSLYYCDLALPLILQAKDTFNLAKCYNNIAVTYHHKHSYEKALEYYAKSIEIYNQMSNQYGLLITNNNIAQIYCDQKKYKEAIKQSYYAMTFLEEGKYPELAADIYLSFARAYLHTNQPDSSERYFELFFNENNALYQKEQQGMINELSSKYKAEEQKKDIELYKKSVELKDKESKQKQTVIYFFIGISVLLIAAIVLAVRSYLQKRNDNRIIESQKQEVELQKDVIEQKAHELQEKQNEIFDSINYAKRIQYSLLAHKDFLEEELEEYFVFFHPKDIVSGDFYWAAKVGTKFYIAACDSTGHGVPGAFMSLLNIGYLNEAIKEKGIEKPNEVLNFVRQRLIDNISKEGQKDGFDGILLCIDQQTKKLSYAAANNAPLIVRSNGYEELDADRMPVGMGERKEDFKLHEINYEKGDVLYLYTDGYADQFGGPKGKKYKYRPLNEMLQKISADKMDMQRTTLANEFQNWRGELEQVDDVLIIGIKL